MHPLARLQRGLEELYRIATGLEIGDFIVDAAGRDALAPDRRPREQLLVHETGGELELGLFIDPGVVDTLARHDPRAALDHRNFGEFVLAVEGVSHFVLTAWCAIVGSSSTTAVHCMISRPIQESPSHSLPVRAPLQIKLAESCKPSSMPCRLTLHFLFLIAACRRFDSARRWPRNASGAASHSDEI